MPRRTPTLNEAIAEYLRLRMVQAARNTVENERSALHRFAGHLGDIQVGNLKPQHCEDFFFNPRTGVVFTHRDFERRGPMAQASRNKLRSHLAQFFKFCIGRGWLKIDPLINVRSIAPPEREKARLTKAQLLQLLELSHGQRDRAMIAVAINTALRASEIVGIRVRDVDLDAGKINVYIPKVKRQTTMPISPHLDRELRSWMTYYSQHGMTPDAYLIPSRTGRDRIHNTPQPMSRCRNPAEIIQKPLREMGFPVWQEGVHTVRRSVARLAFDRWSALGYDSALRMTMALLNHRDSKVTERYLGITPDLLRRDADMRQGFIFDDDGVVELRSRRN